jgi:hypothetical protein
MPLATIFQSFPTINYWQKFEISLLKIIPSLTTTADNKEYVLKSNTWNNRYQLSDNEGFLGESQQKMISTFLSFDDQADDLLIAATIAQTQLDYERTTFIACFVPLFVVIILT